MFSEKSCTAPDPVKNAVISGEYTYGSTVVYTCVRGYYLSAGRHQIICNNGTWQGTKPACSGSSKCIYFSLGPAQQVQDI